MKILSQKTTKGYSLVEVLIAVAILMISIVGPMTIAAKGIQSSQYSQQQNTAFFLAQEEISILNAMRNNNALEFFDGLSADPWSWADSSGMLSPCFTASGCNLDIITDDTLKVTDCAVSADACRLLRDQSYRSWYQTEQGGPSQFERIITLSAPTSDELAVSVIVRWDSQILQGSQEVALSMAYFNIYK